MIDYFKDIKTRDEIYTKPIKVKDEVHDIIPKYHKELSYEDMIKSFDQEDYFLNDMSGMSKEMRLKQEFNAMGMFCFVSWNWINPLAKYLGNAKCLEVMAGRGWLSYALQQKSIDIRATDDMSWHKQPDFIKWNDTVTDIEQIDAIKAVEKYGKEVEYVFMMWPYMDNTAYQVIKKLYEVNPEAKLIYCGEWGGCTADDDFFDHFDTLEDKDFYENVASKYETWWGLHDRLHIGKYSPKKVSHW